MYILVFYECRIRIVTIIKKEKVSVKSMEFTSSVKMSTSGRISIARDGRSQKDYTKFGMKGQVIVGTITKVSKKISIDFNGTEVKVPRSAVRDAREGEERSFEIREVSKDSIVLKEVEKTMHSASGKQALVRTMVGNDKASFADLLEKSGMSDGNTVEGLEQHTTSAVDRMTGEDVQDMEQDGMSVGKREVDQVDRMLSRVKKQRMEREAGLEAYKENSQEQQEQIQQISEQLAADRVAGSGVTEQIVRALENANLPVTENNIKRISRAMDMANVTPDMSDQAMQYMLAQEISPTIGNVYHAQYAGSSQKYNDYVVQYGNGYQSAAVIYEGTTVQGISPDKESMWQEIEPQVKNIIAEAGMEVNAETLKQARWLFSNDLPVTKESLTELATLQQVKEQYDPQQILEKVVNSYVLGEELEGVLLIPENMDATMQSVQAFLAEVEEQLRGVVPVSGKEETFADTDISLVTKRRQLEEVRLKMTADAANRLSSKGISLDVEHIEDIVKELREMEDAYYRSILQEGGVVDGKEQVDLLRHTQETVRDLGRQPSYILGSTLSKTVEITLEEMHGEGRILQAKLDRAGQAYDTLMTRPDRELGDSMQKAFQNIPEILIDMKLDDTEANVRAVKILAYNHMPITEDNVFQVKAYDAQVDQLLKDLHPAVTVELIKRNINPLECTIADLDTTIREIKDELGISDDEKYSKYLYQLEQRHGISQADRATFINIYKLLNNVQKMSGAAVGYVLQTDREMTLENLLTAVRTLKGGGVEAQAGDSSDMQDIKYSRSMLLSQVQESFSKEEDAKEKYYNMVVDALSEEISPSGLEHMRMDMGSQGEEFSNGLFKRNIEQLLQQVRYAKKMDKQEELDTGYEEEFLKNLRQVTDNSSRMISYLNANEIPITIENLMAAGNISTVYEDLMNQAKKTPGKQQEELEETVENMVEGMEDADGMLEQYDTLASNVEAILEARFADSQITSMELQELRMQTGRVGLLRQLAARQDYHIPVVTGENVTNIHLTIVNGTEDAGKVAIRMDSDRFGNISATFEVQNDGVNGVVLCASRKAADDMQEETEQLKERFSVQGMELGRVTYGLQTKSTEAYENTIGDAQHTKDTRQLYQVAKAFIKHVLQMEQIS